MIHNRRIAFGALFTALLLSLAPFATAQTVQPNFDLWITPPGGALHDFVANPIPADFFEPGSQPFDGLVLFTGVPILMFNGQPTGDADTIVERLSPAAVDGGPVTISIELVALSLTSNDPITVGGSGDWDVDVAVGGTNPSGGNMTITRVDDNGGTYTADIDICSVMTFTRVAPPNDERVLDLCADLVPPSPVLLTTTGAPWSYLAEQPLQSPLSGPNFFPDGPHMGPHPGAIPLETRIIPQIPTVSEWGMILLALALMTGGAVVLRRRVGTASA